MGASVNTAQLDRFNRFFDANDRAMVADARPGSPFKFSTAMSMETAKVNRAP